MISFNWKGVWGLKYERIYKTTYKTFIYTNICSCTHKTGNIEGDHIIYAFLIMPEILFSKEQNCYL